MKKNFGMIWMIFVIEIGNFRLLDLEHTLINQKTFKMKKCYYHLIKLPFEVEVAEKFLNGIYYVS